MSATTFENFSDTVRTVKKYKFRLFGKAVSKIEPEVTSAQSSAANIITADAYSNN